MSDTRIMIVVNDQAAGEAYAGALSEAAVSYDIARSFKDMAAMAMETAYNGLVVDVLTLVRSGKEEKVIAYDCINLYPVLRVKWESRERKINLSLLEREAAHDAGTAFKYFVESRCRSFPARTLRKFKRKQIFLNGLICRDDSFAEDKTEKTFSVTLSRGGVFLHTMKDWPRESRLWLRLVDLSDQTPIPVLVRWGVKWGCSRSIPGLGGSFESVTERQEQEIDTLLK